MNFDLRDFADRLKMLMENNNETVYTLAEKVHLSAGTISRYTNAKMEPRRNTLESIANYFSVNPVWLMGADVDKHLEDIKNIIIKIPILGTIAAGQPLLAEENIEGYEYMDREYDIDFCLRVRGDSMINARIYDGDIVFVRKQPDVENGEIAAVIIDGESATLKRVYKINGAIILRPENPNYQDIVFSKKDKKDLKILGRAIFLKSEVK